MKDICVTREFNVRMKTGYYLRSNPTGKSNESKITVGFGVLDPYVSSLELDLGYIASGLFACEGFLRDGDTKLDGSVTFLVQNDTLQSDNVKALLEDLISFTLKARPKIRILKVKTRERTPARKISSQFGSCSLFSGGIDSLSGITYAHEKIGPTAGLFVSHDRMSYRVDYINKNFIKSKKIPIREIVIQRGHSGLQQMRGLVYLVFGALAAKLHNTNKIVISETGQTMFLPQFSPLDEVTLTTHPTLIKMVKSLLHEAYGLDFEFYEPFANLTKAEVISLCELKSGIPSTNSCITTRFANQPVSHCGCCYGCLVRRASCIVAGVEDAQYAKDVLTKDVGDPVIGGWRGKGILPSNLSDLQAMARFARDTLEGRIDDFARFKIQSFSKEDLYRRFALDVMSSLYLLYDKSKEGRNSWARDFFGECLHDKVVTHDILENRIAEVREQKFQPNPDFKI